MALGVTQQAVNQWFDISNTTACKANKDARLTISASDKTVIIEQAKKGTSQKQIAADFVLNEPDLSTIAP